MGTLKPQSNGPLYSNTAGPKNPFLCPWGRVALSCGRVAHGGKTNASCGPFAQWPERYHGCEQWRIYGGRWGRSPPQSESGLLRVFFFGNQFSTTCSNLPIPGSQKFFPNYKFITPGLLMCLRNSQPTNRQWHSYLYLYTMWGGYKQDVIWRYVLRAWCLLDLRQRDYGSLFWSFHVRRLHVNVEVLRIL